MNPRFRYLDGPRKTPWKWATQSLRTLLPYRGQRGDAEKFHWIWIPHFACEWECETISRLLYPGDPGYDTARYEIGFMVGDKGHERLVWQQTKLRFGLQSCGPVVAVGDDKSTRRRRRPGVSQCG